MRGIVVKLDRGYPLVETQDGARYRCEHATALVKGADVRAACGDSVEISVPEGHDKGIIEEVLPRRNAFVRKDPTERMEQQVLAANFDKVFVAEPCANLNVRRLERELVLAHESGAEVLVLLTKADQAESAEALEQVRVLVERVAQGTRVLIVSSEDPASVEAVRSCIAPDEIAILLGKSGVGKSSLVNLLVGDDWPRRRAPCGKATAKAVILPCRVRSCAFPEQGASIDMPGIRGLALWDSDAGIDVAFSDIEELARCCRFSDCRHGAEPGCAVRGAVEEGSLPRERFESYIRLRDEVQTAKKRVEEAKRIKSRTGHPRRWKG